MKFSDGAVEATLREYDYCITAMLLHEELNLPFLEVHGPNGNYYYSMLFVANLLPDGRVIDTRHVYDDEQEFEKYMQEIFQSEGIESIRFSKEPTKAILKRLEIRGYEHLTFNQREFVDSYKQMILDFLDITDEFGKKELKEQFVFKEIESRFSTKSAAYQSVIERHKKDVELNEFIASYRNYHSKELGFSFVLIYLTENLLLIAAPICFYVYNFELDYLECRFRYRKDKIVDGMADMKELVKQYNLDSNLIEMINCLNSQVRFKDFKDLRKKYFYNMGKSID